MQEFCDGSFSGSPFTRYQNIVRYAGVSFDPRFEFRDQETAAIYKHFVVRVIHHSPFDICHVDAG